MGKPSVHPERSSATAGWLTSTAPVPDVPSGPLNSQMNRGGQTDDVCVLAP